MKKFEKTMTNKERFNLGRERAIVAIQNAAARVGVQIENASETTIFAEQGYKITIYIGDTSGHVTLTKPDGSRVPMESASEARKALIKELKETGYHTKGQPDKELPAQPGAKGQ